MTIAVDLGRKAIKQTSKRYSPIGEIRYRPIGEIRYRLIGEIRYSPIGEIRYSPKGEIRYSPIGEIGYSPIGEIQYSPREKSDTVPGRNLFAAQSICARFYSLLNCIDETEN